MRLVLFSVLLVAICGTSQANAQSSPAAGKPSAAETVQWLSENTPVMIERCSLVDRWEAGTHSGTLRSTSCDTLRLQFFPEQFFLWVKGDVTYDTGRREFSPGVGPNTCNWNTVSTIEARGAEITIACVGMGASKSVIRLLTSDPESATRFGNALRHMATLNGAQLANSTF